MNPLGDTAELAIVRRKLSLLRLAARGAPPTARMVVGIQIVV